MPGSPPRYAGDGRTARRWQQDCSDQGRRGVACNREHIPSPPDAGRGFRSAPNGSAQADETELMRVLRGNLPTPIAPRLTASTPAACDECVRQRGEYTQKDPAVDGSIMMRSCMTENTLATACYVGNFPTPRVQSTSDTDCLECFALWFGLTAVSARWPCIFAAVSSRQRSSTHQREWCTTPCIGHVRSHS